MINLLSVTFIGFTTFLVLISMIALLRAKDIFAMAHIAMIFSCYIVPITLVAIEIQHFSITSILKIIVISLVNIVIANIICYLIIQRASINKIQPDAETKYD